MKKKLLSLYYFGNNNRDKTDNLQKKIRDIEWKAIVKHLPNNSKFLDVGCGTGYSMKMAQRDKNCIVYGLDPEPYAHGVDRNWDNNEDGKMTELNIVTGVGEAIPCQDDEFDVVYSSHVLEHSYDELRFLKEVKRVVKDDGVVIIGVPTSTMAIINLISQLIFASHHRIINFIFSNLGISSFPKISFKHLVFLYSHSFTEKTIFYDLKHYRIKNWKALIEKHFTITETILPALYPYPDYLQLFKLKMYARRSSSVFFICKK